MQPAHQSAVLSPHPGAGGRRRSAYIYIHIHSYYKCLQRNKERERDLAIGDLHSLAKALRTAVVPHDRLCNCRDRQGSIVC